MTLGELIAYAFGSSGLVPPLQPIFGTSPWMDTDRFDLVARASGNVPVEPFDTPKLAMMVRTLLEERFKLTLHHESRALPMYALAHNRGVGPQLRPSIADCTTPGAPPSAPMPNAPGPAGDPCALQSGRGYVKAGALGMPQLASLLSNRLNCVVRDRTGLTGLFVIDVTWRPDRAPQAPLERPESPLADLNSRSLVTALREQLGLTLEATVGSVDALIIDGVSPPKPDS